MTKGIQIESTIPFRKIFWQRLSTVLFGPEERNNCLLKMLQTRLQISALQIQIVHLRHQTILKFLQCQGHLVLKFQMLVNQFKVARNGSMLNADQIPCAFWARVSVFVHVVAFLGLAKKHCSVCAVGNPAFGFAMRGDTAEKWPQIIMYLWHVYHSAAEYMPDGVRHRLGKPQLPEAPFNCQDRDSDDIDRHVNGFLKRLQTYSSDIDVHLIGPGTFKGERRHLQHGNQTELFYEYLAFCEARSQSPSSYTTFIRVCNKVIGPHVRSGHLHFRKQSEHSKCDVCVRLKQSLKFRHGRCEAASREANIRAYSMHILSQWLDRQVYWSMRSLSQTWFQSHREFGQRSFGAH